eukprot:scaffold25459_cov30-Tisochrysis_lutea.AAC.3
MHRKFHIRTINIHTEIERTAHVCSRSLQRKKPPSTRIAPNRQREFPLLWNAAKTPWCECTGIGQPWRGSVDPRAVRGGRSLSSAWIRHSTRTSAHASCSAERMHVIMMRGAKKTKKVARHQRVRHCKASNEVAVHRG